MTDAARRLLTTPAVVEDFEVEEDEDEDEDNGEPILELDAAMIDDISVVVADVIIKNMDNLREIEETEPEKIAFFAEEITGAVQDALLSCDFTRDAFDMFVNTHMTIY